MSWDIILFDLPDHMIQSENGLAVFDDDFDPPNMQPLDQLQSCISTVFPDTDWSDPVWGRLETDAASIEFNMGETAPHTIITLHVRGRGTEDVMTLISRTDWRGLDLSTGGWLHLTDDPDKGRRSYQALLDTVTLAQPKPGLFARVFGKT
ncbi:MAG: hypothetical protein P8P66_04840 [Paracoccaceae bacterium]|nr:hypothetical protein [Paracoccaceae bacterium]